MAHVVVEGRHWDLYWVLGLIPPAYRFRHPNWDALVFYLSDVRWYLGREAAWQLHREIEEGDCGGVEWKA